MTDCIRWNDTSRNFPKGQLQNAPPPRTMAQAKADAAQRASSAGEEDEPEYDPGQRGPCPGHEWAFTGTAYGGDDERFHGEGRAYCIHCGADGDA